MNLSLRAKLRLPAGCSDAELQDACGKYYTIYKGVLESAADESVKKIAGDKLNDLIRDARAEGIRLELLEDHDASTAAANISAVVEGELARVGAGSRLNEHQVGKLNSMISKLPDSAKRSYLSALVILFSREDSVESFREAVTHLKRAASQDPENPVYLQMIEDVSTEISNYSTQLAQREQEIEEHFKKEKNKERLTQFFKTSGSVLLWIFGALFTVAAWIFGIACSMCDAC